MKYKKITQIKQQFDRNIISGANQAMLFCLDTAYAEKYLNKSFNNLYLHAGYPQNGIFPLPTCPQYLYKKLSAKFGIPKHYGYGEDAGDIALRNALIYYENLKHNTQYDLRNICLTAGVTYALHRVIEELAQISSKNELLIVGPTYFRMIGGLSRYFNVRTIIASAKNSFLPTSDEIVKAVSLKTAAIFICQPSNPTGRFIPQENLTQLIRFCRKNKIYLILDEVQDNYQRKKIYRHPAEIQSVYVIRLCGPSKTFQLAEYRVGYVIASPHFIGSRHRGLISIISHDIGNPPLAANRIWYKYILFEIARLKSLLTSSALRLLNNERLMQRKLSVAVNLLKSSPNITKIILPDACFNLVFQFSSKHYKSDLEFFYSLLTEEGVVVTPASIFGINPCNNFIRLTFAVSARILHEGIKRILVHLKKK